MRGMRGGRSFGWRNLVTSDIGMAAYILNDPRIEYRSWPEDSELENGNYFCKCSKCSQPFIGYKRRVVCRVCHNLQTPRN